MRAWHWRASGLAFAEDPDLAAGDARIIWLPRADPRVVVVDALPAQGVADALDLSRLPVDAHFLAASGREEVLIRDGPRTLRLSVRSGTLANGPVLLRYALGGFATLEHKLLTLRRLVALRRLGRLPLGFYPRERRAGRWLLALRALDALADGASQREVGEALFGVRAAADWRSSSDYLRLRVQRLARSARSLVSHGYLEILQGGSS